MTPDELLEATLAKARKVPIGGKVDADEAARRAIEGARIEARVRQARRGRFLAGAAAAVAALAVAWGTWSALRSWTDGDGEVAVERPEDLRARESVPSESGAGEDAPGREARGAPRRLRLASGDRLVGSPDVAFDVLSEARDRVVHLAEGDMLFDVAHEPRGSFVVHADDFTVTVTGTVFSVRREGRAIGVRVFEGSVLVRGADRDELQRLGAGDVWVSRPLDAMEEWGTRSEREWRRIAAEGRRTERRGPEGLEVGASSADGREPDAVEAQQDDESRGDPELAGARAMLADGDFEAVLRVSEAHRDEGAWLLLRADALRGVGRDEAAARAYEAAAQVLGDGRRMQAAFAAAQLRAEGSPETALALLARFGITRGSSPLEERARALRIRLLRSLGRDDEADAEELAYEERFGAGRDLAR